MKSIIIPAITILCAALTGCGKIYSSTPHGAIQLAAIHSYPSVVVGRQIGAPGEAASDASIADTYVAEEPASDSTGAGVPTGVILIGPPRPDPFYTWIGGHDEIVGGHRVWVLGYWAAPAGGNPMP